MPTGANPLKSFGVAGDTAAIGSYRAQGAILIEGANVGYAINKQTVDNYEAEIRV